MRLGSVSPISSFGFSKANNQSSQKQVQHSPSFKADVRIARGTNIDGEALPEEQAKPLLQSLVHAMTAYKNLGSDNILIYLKPIIEPGSWSKKPRANIEVTAVFKDPALEVQKLKEDLKNNPDKVRKALIYFEDGPEKEKEINELKRNPEKKLEDFRVENFHSTVYESCCEKDITVTPERLDHRIKSVVDRMTNYIPSKKYFSAPFCWTKKNAFTRPDYEGRGDNDKTTEKLFANYPQWEKDLWDKIGFDYKTEIYESDSIYAP